MTKILANKAAKAVLVAVLEGSQSSPPIKHNTISFCLTWKKNDSNIFKEEIDQQSRYV